MFSKDEAAKLRQQFWTSFGQYMKPVLSAEGLPVNWINYRTGIKNIFFKMDIDNKNASIAIQIAHPDEGIRALFFEQFEELRLLLNDALAEEWVWSPQTVNETGKAQSEISTKLYGVSVYNQLNWPELISFFKPRIIALDAFWSDVKPVFEALS